MTSHESSAIERIHRELHSHLPSEPALRVKALESLLVEKGMVDPQTIDAWIEKLASVGDVGFAINPATRHRRRRLHRSAGDIRERAGRQGAPVE